MKIKNFVFAIAAGSIAVTSCTPPAEAPFDGTLTTVEDSLSYALGLQYGNYLKQQEFGRLDDAKFFGAVDHVMNDAENMPMDMQAANDFVSKIFKKKAEEKNLKLKEEGQKFLEENGKKDGVITTASGLQYEVITEGTGEKPSATDQVEVHYVGTLLDGTEFDSSIKRGQTAKFGLNQVIPGWTEGVQLMPVGSKYKFYVPYNLGYGERGAGGNIKPFSTLVFEVELISIVK